MVRRLELAQAMLHRPAILFLDEPTIGLDPMARHSVWDRLRDLRRDYGMTVLITTHDMEEAEALCDELAILHAGQLPSSERRPSCAAGLGAGATHGRRVRALCRRRASARAAISATSSRRAGPLSAWAEGDPMDRFLRESAAIAQVELIKLLRDPTEMISRAVQPVLWLVVFGQVLAHVRGIHTGESATSRSSRPASSRRACCSAPSSTASR